MTFYLHTNKDIHFLIGKTFFAKLGSGRSLGSSVGISLTLDKSKLPE